MPFLISYMGPPMIDPIPTHTHTPTSCELGGPNLTPIQPLCAIGFNSKSSLYIAKRLWGPRGDRII